MAAVSLVLLLVILSGRFVRYLAEAAAGKPRCHGGVYTLELSFARIFRAYSAAGVIYRHIAGLWPLVYRQ